MTKTDVNAKELADWIGVSDRSVSDLAIRGHALRIGRGKYDLKESIRLYTAHLREMAAGRGDGQLLDLVQERARLSKEMADSQELKNAQQRGEMLRRVDVVAEWSDILRKVRGGVLAIPTRVGQRLGLAASDITKVKEEVHDVLTVLANDG